jgi:hypothetical protein
LPITGPAACWRSVDIKLACAKCGGRTSPMHSPTRQAGVWCAAHCPACNAAPEASAAPEAATPLPDADGAVLAPAAVRGGAFNRPKPWGKAFDKYLSR